MVQNGPESLGVPKAVEGSSSKFPIKVRLQGESRWDESPSTPAASFPAQVEKGGFRSALDALTHLAGRKKDSPANQVSEYQAAREAKREELRSVVQASLAAHAVLSPLIMQVDQQAILKRAYGDKYGDLLGKAEAVGPMLAGFAGLGNEPSAYASAVQAAVDLVERRQIPRQIKEAEISEDHFAGDARVAITEAYRLSGEERQREVYYDVRNVGETVGQKRSEGETEYPGYLIAKGTNGFEGIGLTAQVVKDAGDVPLTQFLKAKGFSDVREVSPAITGYTSSRDFTSIRG